MRLSIAIVVLAVFTLVAAPSTAAAQQTAQQTAVPELIGRVDIEHAALLDVEGSLAAVTAGGALYIIDVAGPRRPEIMLTRNFSTSIREMIMTSERAWVVLDAPFGMFGLVGVSLRGDPDQTSGYRGIRRLEKMGNHHLVFEWLPALSTNAQVAVVNTSNIEEPVAAIVTSFDDTLVGVIGENIYISTEDGVRVFSFEEPGMFSDRGVLRSVDGNPLIAVTRVIDVGRGTLWAMATDEMYVVDEPSLTEVGRWPAEYSFTRGQHSGRYVLIAEQRARVDLWDIGRRGEKVKNPSLKCSIGTSPSMEPYTAKLLSNGLMAVTNFRTGLEVYRCGSLLRLWLPMTVRLDTE